MNKLDIFSQNLRRECARFESIAAVCRLADINRQQFSKYLAGSSLPSAIVLRKICTALNVHEKVLFAQPLAQSENGLPPSSISTLQQLAKEFGGNTSKIYFNDIDFPVGNYFCYFLLSHIPGMVVRSLLRVKKNDWYSGFTRITVFPSARGKAAPMAKGRHKGIILGNSTEYYFLGINRFGPNQISYMTVERNNGTNDNHFTGLAVSRVGNSTVAVKLCLVPFGPETSVREALKSLGLVHQDQLGTEALVLVSMLK